MKHVVWMAASVIVVSPGLACSAGEHAGRVPVGMWSETQAESITSIRGTPVRVRRCEGLGRGQRAGAAILYRSFACLAGARLSHQRFDAVAVDYVLHPLGPYSGHLSRYTLTSVRFGALEVP